MVRDHATVSGFPGGSDGKESTCNAGDLGSISGLGRSPGGGPANHSSILAWRIPTDRGAWRAIVCGVAKTERLSADTHATSGSCCDQSYLMLDFFSRMWFVEFIIFGRFRIDNIQSIGMYASEKKNYWTSLVAQW